MTKLLMRWPRQIKNKMKIRESLDWATEFLEQYGVEHSRRNSELLLSHLLNSPTAELYLSTTLLDSRQVNQLTSLLDQRKKGLPVQYIVGRTEFMGLEFSVNPAVFIPRPETERLVETVIETVNRLRSSVDHKALSSSGDGQKNAVARILDIGTGCGNIAISLTKYLSRCKIIATDASKEALSVARDNAQLHKVQDRVTFLEGDLFKVFGDKGKRPSFEVIVSNPPYIPLSMLRGLPLEVKHEPEIALAAGEDGLDYYRRIIATAPPHLVKDGYLIMEIGFGQLDKIKEMIASLGQFRLVEVVNDYSEIERVVVIQKAER